MRKAPLFAAVAACSLASPAAAAQIVGSYDFSGTNFTTIFGGGTAPANPFTGTFSYTYDTTTNAFVLTSFSGTVGTQHFTIADAASAVTNGALSIYGTPFQQTLGGSDFTLNLTFDNATGQAGTLYQLQYGTADFHGYQALNASLSAVPEPATWAMMLLGFGGIGFAMRRGQKRNPVLPQVA